MVRVTVSAYSGDEAANSGRQPSGGQQAVAATAAAAAGTLEAIGGTTGSPADESDVAG